MKNTHSVMTENIKQSSGTPWRLLLLSVLLFIFLSALAFKINILYIFYGEDGHYMMNLAKADIIWRGYEIGFTNDFMQSLGEVWFPLNTKFIPGYMISTLTNGNAVNSVTAYVIFSLELFATALIISRYIGLNWTASLMSSWVLPIIAMPYRTYPIIYPILVMAPHFTTMIIASSLIFLLFNKLGKKGSIESLFLSIIILMLAFFIDASSPTVNALCVPIIATMSLVSLSSASSSREITFKLAFVITTIILSIISGVFLYSYGLIKFTAAYYLPGDLLNDKMSWTNVSILFHGNGGTCLFVLGILGSLFFAMFGDSEKKIVARGVLAAAIVLIGFGSLTVYYNFWHGPAPLYYEVFLWPFYVVFTVALFLVLFNYLKKMIVTMLHVDNDNSFVKADSALLFYLITVVSIGLMLFLLPPPPAPEQVYPDPPFKSEIVNLLNREIALTPGQSFRGRVANLTGRTIKRPVSWADLESHDFYSIFHKYGNEHRMNGLWFYNIPTLDVYSPLISPTYFLFVKHFFSLPEDQQVRNVMTLRLPEPRWLAALGVRFIITDAPMMNGLVRAAIPLAKPDYLYLYELPFVNLGQYSPTHVIQLVHPEDILNALSKETFDPTHDIVLRSAIPGKLSQASNVSISVEKGFIRIKASSTGNSLVLLPLEFSHCLSVVSNYQQGEIMLLKANLIQTAIYFQNNLDISIRYFTGPFYHSDCRLADAKEFEKDRL